MDKSDDPIIPLPLSVVIDLFLGDRHYGEWPAKHLKWLEPIKVLSKSTFICHVREADEFDPFIETPIIYRYARWKESCDLWLKQKARSEKERQDRFVFEYNVKHVARMLCAKYELIEPWSSGCAFSIMKSPNRDQKLLALDPELKLIKTFDELP